MPISIYPPILQSSQPAFIPSTSYPIYFTLQTISDFDDIGHVQVRIVRNEDNISIANKKYNDGTIYKAFEQIDKEQAPKYAIHILDSDLASGWDTGIQYKVQMRFGLNPMYDDPSNFASWKQEQIDIEAFSEWSTVMIIKPINKPEIYIENAEALAEEQIISSDRMEPTLTPLFFGVCKPVETDHEIVEKFQFNLYKGEKSVNDIEDDDFIETSGLLRHKTVPSANLIDKFSNGLLSSVDQYRFSHILENDEKYTVFYSTITKNGYKSESNPYIFTATQTNLGELKDFTIRADGTEPYCRENGCINIYLKTEGIKLSGSFVVTRTSEKTNYGVWEDIKFFTFKEKEFNDELLLSDFTVESGIRYKYAIQQENSAGLRTTPLFEEDSSKSHYVDFEYSYLYHDNIQLRLMFNQKISSFKHTVLSNKQDTLGSRYPYLSRNGEAYYAEFPISGLISFHMDENQTFLEYREDGYYYNGSKCIPLDKFHEGNKQRLSDTVAYDKEGNIQSVSKNTRDIKNPLNIGYNPTGNNIFVERKFREKVEEFLNNFDYKLYKSPTEGNIVVVLQNVTLTPNETLGRMLFEFSATAYEVMENTIENLDKSGIIDIGKFQGLASEKTILSLGQVDNLYGDNSDKNIYKRIISQEEIKAGQGYRYQVKRVRSIWIDRYPDSNFKGKLTELHALQSKLNIEGESTTEVDKEIEKYEKLVDAITKGWEESTVMISINGKNIIIAPRRIYALDYPITSLELVDSDYPIVVNYICELRTIEDLSVGVATAIDSARVWSQLAGVFTDSADIIMDGYRFDYGPGQPPFRVYSGSNSKIITYDKLGNVLLDSTNFNLYKSLNILDIIKEETRKQVEFIYNLKDGFSYNEETQRWENGPLTYEFSRVISIDIEAEPNTIIKVGKKEDGSDAIKVRIGGTERYRLNFSKTDDTDDPIKYLVFESPSFAIINFKCLTKQTKLKRSGG